MQYTPIIDTNSGPVQGQLKGSISAFFEVPYGIAPTAELRFEKPQPISWQQPKRCLERTKVAPQLPSRLAHVLAEQQPLSQTEDALFLNIWTPVTEDYSRAKKPVVIWLHGGAWMTGGASLDWYDGEHLAKTGDVLVVNVNYRLGPLGWLYVPGATANAGLLDIALAVQWVKENIAQFGGDPENICLMGQSAGGSCIVGLLAMHVRIPRVIIQSASLGRGFWTADEAAQLAEAVLHAAGAKDLTDAKQLPVDNLLKALTTPSVQSVWERISAGSGRAFYCPVLDGTVLPTDLEQNLAQYAAMSDVLIGYTQHEMTAFKSYPNLPASIEPSKQVFGEKSLHWGQLAAEQGRKAWVYRFEHAPTEQFGACHCIELPYQFGNFEAFSKAPMLAHENQESSSKIAHNIQSAWLSFIRGDNPGWKQAPYLKVF